MILNEILIKPVLTEKATALVKNKVYTFEANKKANKNQIKNVLEKIYKVKVGSVRILLRKGKKKKVGRRMKTVALPDKKIVLVKLIEGKIELFPQS